MSYERSLHAPEKNRVLNTLAAINPANNQVVLVVVNATHSDAATNNLPDIYIYPNPATHTLYINLPWGNSSASTITISDASGKQVWKQRTGNGRSLTIPKSLLYIVGFDLTMINKLLQLS